MALTLNVIIATYNRAPQLRRALESLRRVPIPTGLIPSVVVVDNNSTDDTRRVVEQFQGSSDRIVRYEFENRQGQVFARNRGIATTDGDLVAFVDDDEEIGDEWYEQIYLTFSDGSIDFAGGPYKPRWEVPEPRWMTHSVAALLGAHDLGNETLPYDTKLNAVPPGGNCVFRRTLLKRVGPYSPAFGHAGNHPLGNDDTELYHRIVDDGACGFYLPRMVVYHHIPAGRLTKAYARKLKFWGGVAMGQLDRIRNPHLRRIGGIPLYLFGEIVRSAPTLAATLAQGRFYEYFQYELDLWALVGFAYGRHRSVGPVDAR